MLLNLGMNFFERGAERPSQKNSHFKSAMLKNQPFGILFKQPIKMDKGDWVLQLPQRLSGVADFIYKIYVERRAERASQHKFYSRIKQCPF